MLGRRARTAAAADAAEARLLSHAVAWADLHPAESIADAVRFGDTPVPVAGPGAPLVAEFWVAEFAAAVGLPTETGKAYLGEALELRHRLPQTWARVRSGDLAAWRARRIARATIGLSRRGGGVRGRPGRAGSRTGSAPAGGPAGRGGHRAGSCPTRPGAAARPPPTAGTPTCTPPGVLRGHRVGRGRGRPGRRPGPGHRHRGRCRPARRLGSTESLDVRRSQAVGELARHQLALDLDTSADTGTEPSHGPDPAGGGAARPPLRAGDHGAATSGCIWPGWRTPARLVDAEQVRDWCGRPGHQVTVKPVHRPGRAPPRGRVRGPRPARRPDRATRPDLRVPVVHPTRRDTATPTT